jgi:transposase
LYVKGSQRARLTFSSAVLSTEPSTLRLYDELLPHVHSVTLVHPPHVALVTQVPVKTDQKAALALAQLHAAGLLTPVWVPAPAGRALRGLVAQRATMVELATQAKNRLHAVLHRYRVLPPDAGPLFAPERQAWWRALPVSASEGGRIASDLATLTFASDQVRTLEAGITTAAASDSRGPLLIQLPGLSLIGAATLLAAIDDIRRFPDAAHLVGYAGLGARVHDSGQSRHTGRITKQGRRDVRSVLVEAAQVASRHHPHWRAELARLEPRLGRNKAIVALARKLRVAVWHVLAEEVADRHADPAQVARFLAFHGCRLGKARRPEGQTVPQYVRTQLDRLGLGAELDQVNLGSKTLKLPAGEPAARPAT